MDGLIKNADTINKLLARYGVKFGVYKNGEFKEQLFPFDPIPRIIDNKEFSYLEKGLTQRVKALNCFLSDIYGRKLIIKDGVIPEEFIYSAKGFLPPCDGVTPPKNIYSHISGIDLVQSKDENWYILEDNLRVPSGASYPMIARELQRRSTPDTFLNNSVIDNRNYADLLKEVMDYVNTGGINVILSPGRYNAAFFEHSYLAERTGAILTTGSDIVCENDNLYYIDYNGKKQRIGAVYRRISDEYLDPMTFYEDSVIGIPHIFEAYKKGNVALLNAPGNGVADDKGIYYFVPKMIKYYLGEESILLNAPTYLPYYEQDMKYVLSNFDNLVIKDVAEAGGYGVVFGNSLTKEKKNEFIELLKKEPRRFIAQEVIDFYDLDILDNGERVPRKADLRAFVLSNGETKVWPSGLTRFSRNPDSFIVNSSQGGGFKDTWVLSR
ncbi:circularly permuted type 2 ATP-grasp protein [Ruminococcus sp.]|uniref:circularly permuted type 2 ATP-grasp protein n=1 Tax=Ruminococcus sp. TaxID=41978 RepID=UPI0026361294|nr:circularly permuted type 2 ATP-grasp protein [Ruminococcus sp.]MDD6988020.1 circularly permuted type 2 ATP-grasp protein [Ruminococcus sp.]MDY6202716.1 circularly permuted type 2 ATP-grasp protein [Ruminococcus sp.]